MLNEYEMLDEEHAWRGTHTRTATHTYTHTHTHTHTRKVRFQLETQMMTSYNARNDETAQSGALRREEHTKYRIKHTLRMLQCSRGKPTSD